MLKSKIKTYWPISYLVIVCILGITIGVLLSTYFYHYIQANLIKEVSFQIDPLNFVSIVITVILVAHVSRKIQSDDDVNKIERQLLIESFRLFEKEFTERIREIASNGFKFTHAVRLLKSYRMRAQILLDLAIEQRFVGANSQNASNILNNIQLIKTLITDTPARGEVENGIRLSPEGLLSYSDSKKDEIVKAIFNLDTLIFRLVVEFNMAERRR